MDCSHTRLPCPSLSSEICSNSCPLNRWCHSNISSSIASFSFCPQSFPASGAFPMNRLFTSGGQSVGPSASTSVFPMNIQGWFLLGLTSLIAFLSKGLSRVFSSTTVQKHQFFSTQPFLLYSSHIYTWLQEKPYSKVSFYFYFWPSCTAHGILVPWPGIETTPPAVETWVLNRWTAREVSGGSARSLTWSPPGALMLWRLHNWQHSVDRSASVYTGHGKHN